MKGGSSSKLIKWRIYIQSIKRRISSKRIKKFTENSIKMRIFTSHSRKGLKQVEQVENLEQIDQTEDFKKLDLVNNIAIVFNK